ncbi:MAG: hypothetical protein MZV49_15590 [Rhodopseudomonas palustris]|nr:hypothetical protein [Rhodopseudomonas palustris]
MTIWTAFPDMHDLVLKLAEKYMKENPNIKITATLFPQRAQEEKVAVALPAGQAADLIELDKFEPVPILQERLPGALASRYGGVGQEELA